MNEDIIMQMWQRALLRLKERLEYANFRKKKIEVDFIIKTKLIIPEDRIICGIYR